MRRNLYGEDHESFRESVAEFVAREVAPNLERWHEQGLIDRDVWLAAGRQGIIGLSGAAEYGGAGVDDYRFRAVVCEEMAKAHATSVANSFALQDDIIIPYLRSLGTTEQNARWQPGLVAGELIGAVAMTEPGAGSDLRGIATTATRADGGWVLNGSKTFITSGIQADIVITVARTGESGSLTLFVVEGDTPGFSRGRKLVKIGLAAQDTAELFYDDVFVPDANVLGEVGGGLAQLVRLLPLERLSIAVNAVAVAEQVLADTVEYVKGRLAFGRRLADLQNTQFELAEMATETDVARSYLDRSIQALTDGELTAVDAAKAKWWATDLQNRVIDRCLQLHGGYGYMAEYPVARAFVDARVQRIYGGANEVMKHIIGRDLVGRAS